MLKTRKLIATNNGEDTEVELVISPHDLSEDDLPQTCEHCGEEVWAYVITAEEETWRMAECLPCLLMVVENLRSAEA